jgi:phospholipid-binding lipoprotein MlaA
MVLMQRMPAVAAAVLAVVFLFVCLPPTLSAAETKPAATGQTPVAAPSTDQDDYEDEYDDDSQKVTVADPLQTFNQDMYVLNDFLMLYVLEPAAKAEKVIIPWEFRTMFRNMLQNIRFPVRFVNALLQAKWEKAGDEFASFFLNTTVGFLGMADVSAAYPGLQKRPEDMGQTFAVWGWEESSYLTLPFFGPSTVRDALGKLPDVVMDPLFWLIPGTPESIALRGGEAVNDTSFHIGDYEVIKKASLDPYVAIRNGYIQNRRKLIGE